MKHTKSLKIVKLLFINFCLVMTSTPAFSQTGISRPTTVKKSNSEPDYNINELALPSELKNVQKGSGSIFYNPSIKGKVLIPVHFWGYFSRPGLHFIPVESSLLEGVSYAGGPTPQGKLDNVRHMRKSDKSEVINEYFDLEKGGSNKAALMKLQPGDMVFVERDNWMEDRAYYTGLIGVVATILSSILIYREVKKGN